MILWKHVAGLAAVATLMAAWPRWSAAQETPPKEAQSATRKTSPDPAADPLDERTLLEARLRRIEASLELIFNHFIGSEGTADPEADRGSNAGGPMPSTLQPRTSRTAAERGEGVVLDTADRRYEIVYENGRCALEAVELSSGKAVWKTEVGAGLNRGLWRLSKSDDGKLLRAESASEDSSVAFTIDAETGRTTKQEILTSSNPHVTVAAPRRVPLVSGIPWRPPYSPFRSPPPALPAPPSPQGEILNLATAYVDAIGNLRLARSKYDQLKALRGPAAASASELDAAAINLETAQQKVTLLAGVVDAASEAAKAELDVAERMYVSGLTSAGQVVAARSKAKTLASIVQQRNSANSPSSSATRSSFAPRN